MKQTHLVLKQNGSSVIFHFRSRVPKDLISRLGRRQFLISLGNGLTYRQSIRFSFVLYNLVQEIYSSIRSGMRKLSIDDIKEILKVEVRKSILYSHQVNEQTNKHTDNGIIDGLHHVSDLEKKIQSRVDNDLKGYREEVEDNLEGILKSLDIKVEKGSVDFRKLRNRFIDLYLIRTSWMKDLLKDNERTEEDWKREIDDRFRLNLYEGETKKEPETNLIQQSQKSDQETKSKTQELSNLEMTPISNVIDDYIKQKGDNIRERTEKEIRVNLNLLVDDFGDISIGSLTREMSKEFKDHIMKLPKNKRKNPKYRELSFHQILKKNIPQQDKLSRTSINKTLSICSSFMEWSKNDHYVKENLFGGMMLKKDKHPREETEPFTNKEIRTLFEKKNYFFYTIEKRRYELYWVPLISLFSGLRLGEITSLYCDNIRKIEGNHRERRWCFDIVEEPLRPDKRLKNRSSRRIVPIHDTLINLGLIEYLEIVKKKLKEQRLFFQLPHSESNYNKNVSTFWNRRYLPQLNLKSKRKTFHSIRHTCSNHLKQKGIPTDFIQELLGHTTGKITLERYGDGYNPSLLYTKCISKIIYQTSSKRYIDFMNLKYDWKKMIV